MAFGMLFAMTCLRSGGQTSEYIYTMGFWLKKHTPLLLYIETLLQSLSLAMFSGQLEPNYCLFKLFYRDGP